MLSMPNFLKDRVSISYSEVKIGTFNGQLCHHYSDLPNIIADFIYLDGPHPKQVKGDINGLNFSECSERTIMAGDLLLMEPTFLPGTFILVDGRTNNARFLNNNFKRNYKMIHDKQNDFSSFELIENTL